MLASRVGQTTTHPHVALALHEQRPKDIKIILMVGRPSFQTQPSVEKFIFKRNNSKSEHHYDERLRIAEDKEERWQRSE